MIRTQNRKIIMTEGDFGLVLPITITGAEISENEKIKFCLRKTSGEDLIEPKVYNDIKNNTFDLIFTKAESDLIKRGTYLYYLDWYKENVFLGNIINGDIFEVEGK